MPSYIIKTIVLTLIFLFVIYVFIFLKIRKRKTKASDLDSVRDYHDAYLEKKSLTEYHKRINASSAHIPASMSGGSDESGYGRTNFITRYNSTEDYREKAPVSEKSFPGDNVDDRL